MQNLEGNLFVGIEHNGNILKGYSLLRSNGVAEKVFTDKSPNKPYTWMANIMTIAIGDIEGNSIAAAARQDYVKSGGSVTHNPLVLKMPLPDLNMMLVEVHRRVWKNLLRNQDNICKYCGNKMVEDVDLDRIHILPEDEWKLEKDWQKVVVDLPCGWEFEPPKIVGSQQATSPYEDYRGIVFNRFTFRIPTVQDAIRNEKHCQDSITFWRLLAFDCLESIAAFDNVGKEDESFVCELPITTKAIFGKKIFDEILYRDDLEAIRVGLRETAPTLPFYYLEECANPSCKQDTPITIEASSFFSE